jgi:exonuclease SbcC
MIKSVSIQNFQSHAKTELDFHEGVNVIVGTTDGGKTAIIRALRWLIWNRPSGDALRSRWGGATNVQLETEEGVITRSKDKIDKYTLRLKGQEDIEFKAIGTSVPTEIQRVLNISEINLQNQHDATFLLSDTPGAVATHFNKVARLDRIDTATSAINGWIRGLKSDVSHLETDIATEKAKLPQFENLEKFEIEIEALEQMEGKAVTMRSRYSTLEKDIVRITNLEKEIETLTPLLGLEKLVTSVLDDITKRDQLQTQVDELQTVIDDLEELNEKEEAAKELMPLEPLVLSLLDKYKQLRELKKTKSQLQYLLNQVNLVDDDIVTTGNNVTKLETKFHKEMPDICPLCDTILKK